MKPWSSRPWAIRQRRSSRDAECGGQQEQPTRRDPVFTVFVLLYLLRTNTHDLSQGGEAQHYFKSTFSETMADMDVDRMNLRRHRSPRQLPATPAKGPKLPASSEGIERLQQARRHRRQRLHLDVGRGPGSRSR